MNLKVQYIVLLWTLVSSVVIGSAISSAPYIKRIRINSVEGNDAICLAEHADTPCKSFQGARNLLMQYRNNVLIILENNVTLNNILEIANSSNIAIIGNDRQNGMDLITISCRSDNTGFKVTNVSGFNISYLSIMNCNAECGGQYFAMLITLTSNVVLKNVHFECFPCCNGSTALVLQNNHGRVIIQNSSFGDDSMLDYLRNPHHGNHYLLNSSYTGGISIDQTLNDIVNYSIIECSFHNNTAPVHEDHPAFPDNNYQKTHEKLRGRGYGGGIFIFFGGSASNSTLSIRGANFINNNGKKGGAIYAYFGDHAMDNNISIRSTLFEKNHANISGGGVSITYYNSQCLNNKVFISECKFFHNHATVGAGISINLYLNCSLPVMVVSDCEWLNNTGLLSPTVDISPIDSHSVSGFLPTLYFTNCRFFGNLILKVTKDKFYHLNTGVFLVTKFKVIFQRNITFSHNKYSAVILLSARLEIEPNSNVLFENNYGHNGGAVVMYGFSTMIFHPYSYVKFLGNHAYNHGGAIFYRTVNQHDFLDSDTCFLRNANKSLVDTAIVVFENNSADSNGSAIYSESFLGCYYRCLYQKGDDPKEFSFTAENIFNCTGRFEYNWNKEPILLSSGRKFKFDKTIPPLFYIIPGSKQRIQLEVVDDFYHKINSLLSINRIHNHVDQVDILSPYVLSNDMIIQPLGKSKSVSNFGVSADGLRQIYFYINISLLPCPPGFYLENNRSCICGDKVYDSVINCDENFQAEIKSNMWVGYIPQTSVGPENLFFSLCSSPLCKMNVLDHHLPNSSDYLVRHICGATREGIMCGKCTHNRSVFYHSRNSTCGVDELCNFGFLFYFLSEIVPMVIFFIIVIMFDLSFTSGKAVGFVFFSQCLNHLILNTNNIFTHLRTPYHIFYGLFNFEFFLIENLSFCLWKGAQILDVIAFKYVTILFAFGLVLILVVSLNNLSCYRLCHLQTNFSTKSSLVHGLSAFLIICYAQCTKVSFYILKYSRPMGYRMKYEGYYSYYGGLPFFHSEHLMYAIPALFSLVVVTILPPLILLLYPLSLQLLSLCGLHEHWIVHRIIYLTRINKLIPFFDCFQSCYKDQFRFFAGLYFIYRILIFVCFVATDGVSNFCLCSVVLLFAFLLIHSISQPYQERKDNIIESVMFFNLAMITSCNYILDRYKDGTYNLITAISIIELILLYLPMIAILWMIIKHFNMYLRKKCRGLDTEMNNILKDESAMINGGTHRGYGTLNRERTVNQ